MDTKNGGCSQEEHFSLTAIYGSLMLPFDPGQELPVRHPHKLLDRARLAAVIEGSDERFGAACVVVIHSVVVASLVTFAISTMPSLSPLVRTALHGLEAAFLCFFIAEYALRLYAANVRWRYVVSLWGVIDLLAFLPTLLLPGSEGALAKAFRTLRVLRLFKLMRGNAAVERFIRALTSLRAEFTVFAIIVAVLLFICSTAIYYFEHAAQPDAFASIPHSMWWAVVTLTTVGYGDVYPVTVGGRIFTGIVLLVGLGIVALPTGLIASALSNQRPGEPSAG